MSVREGVRKLVAMGPLPAAEVADEGDLERRVAAIDAIARPVTDEEAALLVSCFGPDDCFGVAWPLLHLVETAPTCPIRQPPGASANEWHVRLWERWQRTRAGQLRAAIARLIEDLVAGRYAAIVGDGRAGRLTAAELRGAIETYGRTPVPLPDAGWALIEITPLREDGKRFAVDVPLWTREEGRSDLTLSLTATERTGAYDLVIDALHVL